MTRGLTQALERARHIMRVAHPRSARQALDMLTATFPSVARYWVRGALADMSDRDVDEFLAVIGDALQWVHSADEQRPKEENA